MSKTGGLEVYDIANNQLTGAVPLEAWIGSSARLASIRRVVQISIF